MRFPMVDKKQVNFNTEHNKKSQLFNIIKSQNFLTCQIDLADFQSNLIKTVNLSPKRD